jgi:Ca-activated chloride channel family protein
MSRWRFKRRTRALLYLVGRTDGSSLLRELGFRYTLSVLFFLAAMAAVILALAGPRWGQRLVPEFRRGLDVVLAFDVSRSMNAQDTAPSRIRRASAIAMDVAAASPGIRFGVALGKGGGVLALPLTSDRESVAALCSSLSDAVMSSRGTDLERLLDSAAKGFLASSSARRLVVLFSDGESLSGKPESAASRLSEAGIVLAAVGLGTAEGAPVPGAVPESSGMAIRSSLREPTLRDAASRTGGSYIDGNSANASVELIRILSGLSSAAAVDGFRKEAIPRYPELAFLALFLFMLSRWVETVPRRRP